MHPKRVTVWCGFWSRGKIFENKQGEAVTVNGDRYRAMFVPKNQRGGFWQHFGFNWTALRATQPKLQSIFCALFLKIALSHGELMSFGHLGVAIWHRWTIICGKPLKISVTPTSQRQLTL